jgi:hypothetical protein
MARYLKYGSEHGVKAIYAEHYGAKAWIDGPKMYVMMKLLWDPSIDVDATLAEWYRLAVGEKAAAPLAKYYQLWEDYWMQRVPETDWYKQYVHRTYFDFDQLGYLDPLTLDDLAESDRLIGEVVALAETPEQKKRAEFIADGFEGYRKDVEYVIRLRGKTVPPEAVRETIVSDSFVPPSAEADDKVPLPWAGWQNEPGTARLYWDHEHGQSDSHSLAVNAEGAGAGVVFYRDFPVEHPADLHHLRVMVQCIGVNEDASVGIQIRWRRADDQYLPRKYTANEIRLVERLEDGKWVPLDVFAYPPSTDGAPLIMTVQLSSTLPTKGVIRFDDVTLNTVDEKKILAD